MALIRKAPRTKPELEEITGLHENTVSAYVKALKDEGHIRICDRRSNLRGRATMVYAWQDVPHGEPDFITGGEPVATVATGM